MVLILKFIVTFKRAGKANPWRRLSLLNKHYNNYWWPNAVALALERIHNPVEVLNQTARYKHYSKTYYLSPPPPPPTRVRQGGGPHPLGILVLPPILCRRLAFCYCGSYKKVWNVLCHYLSCSLVHVHSSFLPFRCWIRPELTRCIMGKVKMVNSVTESDCFRPLNTSHVKKPKQKCPNITGDQNKCF